jgi:anaerobic dimethyl sulfoxide reductase subunit A
MIRDNSPQGKRPAMKLKRRDLLKLGLASAAAATFDLKFFHLAKNAAASSKEDAEKVVRLTCSPNCTGACGFNAHVSNGRINTLIQSADYPEDEYNPRGCLRGLSTTNLSFAQTLTLASAISHIRRFRALSSILVER